MKTLFTLQRGALLAMAWLLAAYNASAQEPSVYERLRSKKADNFVILKIEKNKRTEKHELFYEIDNTKGPSHSKPINDKIEVSVQKECESVNILTEFLNPLRFSVAISEEINEDEIYKNTTKFMEAIGSLASLTTATIPLSVGEVKKSTGDAKTKKNEFQMLHDDFTEPNSAKNGVLLKRIQSTALINWGLWYNTKREVCIDTGDTDTEVKFLSTISKVEDFLFNRFQIKKADNIFEAHVSDVIKRLSDAANLEDLRKELRLSHEIAVALSAKLNNIRDSVNSLTVMANSLRWKLEKSERKDQQDEAYYYYEHFTEKEDERGNDCPLIKEFTISSISNYVNKVKDVIKKRTDLLEQLQRILSSLDDFIVYNKENVPYIKHLNIKPTPGEINTLTIVVKSRDVIYKDGTSEIESTDKETYQSKLVIYAYDNIIPEVSVGAVYANLSFPKYAVEGGAVVSAGHDHLRFVPVIALNLLINTKSSSTFPFIQFGVGTGDGRPTFMSGLGYRLFSPPWPANVSISAGAIWKFVREPGKYKIGDTGVTEVELEKDLEYRFVDRPGFYLGLQYKF